VVAVLTVGAISPNDGFDYFDEHRQDSFRRRSRLRDIPTRKRAACAVADVAVQPQAGTKTDSRRCTGDVAVECGILSGGFDRAVDSSLDHRQVGAVDFAEDLQLAKHLHKSR